LIEDDPERADSLRQMLSQEKNPSFKMECAKKLQTELERLSQGGIDAILLDRFLPDGNVLDALFKVYAQAPTVPALVLTDLENDARAVEAIRRGAQDYLFMGHLHSKMLSRVIRHAIERKRAETALRKSSEERLRREKTHSDALAKKLWRTVKELRETRAEIIQREKALTTGELAAGVAHEIRNPLSIISMSVQYLQSKFPARDPRREFTEAIVGKVEHLDRITKRLLSFGRRREMTLRRQSIHGCLNRVISLFKVKCRSQGVKVIKRYRKGLPKAMLDEEAVEEVLSNLVANAVEAMPRGGRLTIRTFLDGPARAIAVGISDTGSGIPHKLRGNLFHLFFSTKKEKGGSGLGLAISRRLVDEHGGTIAVDTWTSGARHGTVFTVRFPIAGPKAQLKEGGIGKR